MNEFEHEEHDEEPSAPQQPPQHIEAPVDALGRRVNLPEDEDELERSLTEFDAATKPTEPEQEQESDSDLLAKAISAYDLSVLQKAGITEASTDYEIRAALEADNLHRAFSSARDRLLEVAQHVSLKIDQADLSNALRHVRQTQPGCEGMSDKLLTAYLVHEHATNMNFRGAWEDRYNSPGHWANRLEKAAQQLAKQILPPIDPDATADREAVTFFMRHGSTKHAAGENPLPKNLTSMSNSDYARFLKESFNIHSRL